MQGIRTQKVEPALKLFQGETWLTLTGLLGFLLAGWCAVWVILKGGAVPPEGNVSDAFSFDAALGLFLLTTAAILPLSGMSTRGRTVFRWSYIVLALYSYSIETIQHFRGINPRFTEEGGITDVMLGIIFGVVALFLVLFYLILAVQYFRRKTSKNRPELILGIRYAMVMIMISFVTGICMSVLQGRYIGTDGNMLWLHTFGFHAVQAIPFIAWLSERMAVPSRTKRRYIHFAGIIYLAGLFAIGCQTFMGRSIFEWSLLPLFAFTCILIWVGIAASALRITVAGMKKANTIGLNDKS